MALPTRKNPETGVLEVLFDNEWVLFETYRKQQIDEAYQNSIRFLRERLGEDSAREVIQSSVQSEKDQADQTNQSNQD
jgi:hypothetical protein